MQRSEEQGKRDKYSQLNAEFQRIARRDKTAFFNEQFIKIEENNIMGKIRDVFRKIGTMKGTFCPKMDTTKEMVET